MCGTCTATPCSAWWACGLRSRLGAHTMAMLRAVMRVRALRVRVYVWHLYGDAVQRVVGVRAPQQVGRPHYGHVARRHARAGATCTCICVAPVRRRRAARGGRAGSAAGWAPTLWPCCAPSCACGRYVYVYMCGTCTATPCSAWWACGLRSRLGAHTMAMLRAVMRVRALRVRVYVWHLYGDAVQRVVGVRAPQQVGRPHYGHVARRHARAGATCTCICVAPVRRRRAARGGRAGSAAGWAPTLWPCCAPSCACGRYVYVYMCGTCTATPCSAWWACGLRSRLGAHTMAMLRAVMRVRALRVRVYVWHLYGDAVQRVVGVRAPQQVGRPHYGHVARRHARAGATCTCICVAPVRRRRAARGGRAGSAAGWAPTLWPCCAPSCACGRYVYVYMCGTCTATPCSAWWACGLRSRLGAHTMAMLRAVMPVRAPHSDTRRR
ncbi:unnamed protein product [Diatraea saccharalis]|uniref:Uncharacterized protein n=1 Tax=Diatraea saccharalis TaxID=40085 RepID=A0A9N9RDL1_9NEOP|nr:unnamed protein product [Diatraea saccharalis]